MFNTSCVQLCALCGGRVGATNRENIYHLCILLVFTSNYSTMHGVRHIRVLKMLVLRKRRYLLTSLATIKT
jgi:hypothetical protein